MMSTLFPFALALLGISSPAAAWQAPQPPAADSVPLDPQVRRGKLPNGFEYFIRRFPEPKAKAEIRLVVNAGTLHEDPDQLGLAHLLEHMAFNGTTHYPHDTMREYFDKSGLAPGNDWNASTGVSTTYQLRLPTDKPALYESGFQIMRDWAQGLTLDSVDIDPERGVVLGESRNGEEASFKRQVAMEFTLLDHPKYPMDWYTRHNANINGFKHDVLRRFYRDWYRPDLEALVVVGDIDVAEVEKRIRELFADLVMPAKPRPAPDVWAEYAVPLTGKNQFLVFTGEDMSSATVRFYQKRKGELRAPRTTADYRREMMDKLFGAMARERLDALKRRYNVPFQAIYAMVERGTLRVTAGLDAMDTYISVEPSQSLTDATRTAITELERIRRHGFLASELARAKTVVRKELADARKPTSADVVNRLVGYSSEGAAAPDLEYERKLRDRLLDEIDVAAMNEMASGWLGETTNRDVVIMAPTSMAKALPSEQDVNAWFAEARTAPVAAYAEPKAPVERLMSEAAVAALKYDSTYTSTENDELGLTEIRLRNGIKIVLKAFKPEGWGTENLALQGFSAGGSRAYGTRAFTATRAATIVRNSGVGNIDKFSLETFLTAKDVSGGPYLGDDAAIVGGSSRPAELETMLQLVHLYMTAPRHDAGAFDDWRRTELSSVEQSGKSKDTWFQSVIDTARYRGMSRTWRPMREDVEGVREADAYRIYEERFLRPGDFTFVLAGDFDPAKATPLLVKYLGSLPATKAKKPSGPGEPMVARMGTTSATVYRGTDDKAEVRLFFSGRYAPSLMSKVKLQVLANALQIKMNDRLREKEGGTYSVNSWVDNRSTRDAYSFSVSFTAATDNLEHMIAAAVEEMNALKTAGLDSALYEAALARAKDNPSDRLGSPNFWTTYLQQKSVEGGDLGDILKRQTLLSNIITRESLNAMARASFGTENMMRFVLLPAKDPPAK